jgi:hypothetical protein
VTPMRLPPNAPARYRDTIDRLVYPAVESLVVETVPCASGVIVVICVPLQPEAHKPYLVHGAVVAGKNEGLSSP